MRAHRRRLRRRDADLSLDAPGSARRRPAARGHGAGRHAAELAIAGELFDEISALAHERAGLPRRRGHAPRPRAGHGAVSERALVLLSGAESRAVGSVVDASTNGERRPSNDDAPRAVVGDHDRIPDARVWRGRRRGWGWSSSLRPTAAICSRIRGRTAAIPIRFHDEDASVEAILEAAAARPIDGLLVVGDRPTVIGARVAERLGLPWHPPAGAEAARHKLLTRERLRDAGLPVPWFVPVSRSDPPTPNPDPSSPLSYPVRASSRWRCPAAAA